MKATFPEKTYFQGAISFERGADYIRPWRLPYEEFALFEPEESVPDKAGRAAGIRLRFQTNSPIVELEATCTQDTFPLIDLVAENQILATNGPVGNGEVFRFPGLDGELRTYELWLPVFSQVRVRALRVADGATLEPVADERVRWLTYGSSITHCRTSYSPARAWPATAARELDLNLTCLGYGGNCHLEPMVARMIRDQAADIITLKLGINVYGSGSLNMRTFRHAVIGLVKLIREKHPETPIGLITPIYGCEREESPNGVGMTLENYREELRGAYKALKSLCDAKLFLFEGTELFGEDEKQLLPDNLHPNGEGYELMGKRAAEKILPVLLDARA
ncbi:SGNH/GDSL hydrolase family protein [Cerasicoccus maritimus]|uniref:SGNH/GDSL hydrolase family protein n=1 Tax=Cerasicoccus maritimus TaxID=490089 RepID=UPI00285299ED|nr:SGNH/GDSL hydrolase family protein [Cerasicoccus maritimus]